MSRIRLKQVLELQGAASASNGDYLAFNSTTGEYEPNPQPIGEKGEKGEAGQKGEAGVDGASGTAGTSGAAGPQGDKGDKGDKGESGTGFTTISNAANNSILTSDGSPNSAVAEANMTFDGNSFVTVSQTLVEFLTDEHRLTSFSNADGWKFDGNSLQYNSQTAMLVDPGAMVVDTDMLVPIPMVWDQGGLGIGYQVSSLRFKENVETLQINEESLFQNVRGVTYTGKDNDRVQVGFIAEEVEQYDPKLVIHDDNGDPFSLDYGRMVPVLFEVIRNLRERIAKLEQK